MIDILVNNAGVGQAGSGDTSQNLIGCMTPPLNWLVSDAAGGVTGRRFLAVHWDPSLPPEEAAAKAGAPVAWTEIATVGRRNRRDERDPNCLGTPDPRPPQQPGPTRLVRSNSALSSPDQRLTKAE
jgi:hypothetical protein